MSTENIDHTHCVFDSREEAEEHSAYLAGKLPVPGLLTYDTVQELTDGRFAFSLNVVYDVWEHALNTEVVDPELLPPHLPEDTDGES